MNGVKRWQGNGNRELCAVFARNTETKEINAFMIHLDWPGVSRSKIDNKMSLRAVHNMNIKLDNVKVPGKYRLPKVNSFKDLNKMLLFSRLMVGWGAVGVGIGIYDNMIKYLANRKQFDRT